MATDWIGTAATALVGVTGITATLWVTISGRRAADRQAEIRNKSRSYTTLFLQSDRVVSAMRRFVAARRTNGDARLAELDAEMEDSRIALNTALYDLKLVAPAAVIHGAVDLYFVHLAAVERVRAGEDDHGAAQFAIARRALSNLMREDLGRAPVTVRDSPSMTRMRLNDESAAGPPHA